MKFWLILTVAAVLAVGCSDSDGKKDSDALPSDGSLRGGPDGSTGKDGERRGPATTPAFTDNAEICKTGFAPLSAVTSKVDVNHDLMQLFAQRLEEEGFEVYMGPEEPYLPDPGELEDVITPAADINTRESYELPDWNEEETPDIGFSDVPETPLEVVEEPSWTGGKYVIARTPRSDLLFVLESGVIGVVSWCPADSLGQIRRLDYTLADAVRIWGMGAGYDYVKETKAWAAPVSYYTQTEGAYQRSYMNDSLDMNEPHNGQLSIAGEHIMAGFALYGHADAPSQVGDVVGVDLLQIGQTVIAENDTVTISGQVTLLWDVTPLAGEGENLIVADPFVSDASINWQVGHYYFFADAVFPGSIHGSFVLNLQGSPPGKLIVSKAIDALVIPPTAPLL